MENSSAYPEEFEQAARDASPKLCVAGCGGAGCNTVSRLTEMGVSGIESIAVNTDAQDLLYTNADRKVLIGRDVTGGLGAGNDPKKGRKAAKDDEDLLKDRLHGADMAFITCGLGGGTGTGAGPVVANVASRMGALTMGVLTTPFKVEGERRRKNAKAGLEAFRKVLDSVVVVPDEKLLEISPDLSIPEAFKLADTVLADSIRGITELVTKTGLINLDFADIETVLENGGDCMLGVGESNSENRHQKAVEEALENPLLEVDTSRMTEALVHVAGSPDLSLEEAKGIAGRISESLAGDADLIWGALIDEDLKESVKVLIITPGAEARWCAEGRRSERGRKSGEEALKDLKKV